MARRNRNGGPRIYTRSGRYYADFRKYARVGGGREALKPEGSGIATDDADIARKLAEDRWEELRRLDKMRRLYDADPTQTLNDFAAHYLVERARENEVTDRWLNDVRNHLRRAIEFFGADRSVASIQAPDVMAYISWLSEQSNGNGRNLSPETRKKHLFSLQSLFQQAQLEGVVPSDHNPVRAIPRRKRPSGTRDKTQWFEVHEAAYFLEAARLFRSKRPELAIPQDRRYAMMATFLLTGGRRKEVLCLLTRDIDFEKELVWFRPNKWSKERFKTDASEHRSVPLWPQLAGILCPYIERYDLSDDDVLFPSHWPGSEGEPITDTKKIIARILEFAKLPDVYRTTSFRHTYASARLQTLDGGEPVSPKTVASELGHVDLSMVMKVYGHLGKIRHRKPHVEYRVEQHEETLGDRLKDLRSRAQS